MGQVYNTIGHLRFGHLCKVDLQISRFALRPGGIIDINFVIKTQIDGMGGGGGKKGVGIMQYFAAKTFQFTNNQISNRREKQTKLSNISTFVTLDINWQLHLHICVSIRMA